MLFEIEEIQTSLFYVQLLESLELIFECMTMKQLFYLWNFKPNEMRDIPSDVIRNNEKYFSEHWVISPDDIPLSFPKVKEVYYALPKWVSQTDLARLLYVYEYGGIYCDVDCFIKKSFELGEVTLFVEWVCKIEDLGPRECKTNLVRIANYCFSSTPKHPFIKEVIEECIRRVQEIPIAKPTDADILWCCGPDVITTIYHLRKDIYPNIQLYNNNYLDHRCYGSWR